MLMVSDLRDFSLLPKKKRALPSSFLFLASSSLLSLAFNASSALAKKKREEI